MPPEAQGVCLYGAATCDGEGQLAIRELYGYLQSTVTTRSSQAFIKMPRRRDAH